MIAVNRRRLLSSATALAARATAPLAASRRAGIKKSSWLRASPALCAALMALALPHGPAFAKITKVTVDTSTDIGPFRGKAYREVQATMEGSAPGGPYAVPITLAFPKEAADHNGFAVVDVINSTTVGGSWPLGGMPLFPLARMHMENDFLFGTGNSYVGVVWDKKAVEALKSGTIANPGDGYTILRDAAALVRDPSAHLVSEAAPASAHVIAYGYSQTGSLLRGWYAEKLNSAEGSPTFDGALVGGAAGYCKDLDPSGDAPCAGVLSDGGKVMVLLPEGDVEWTGFIERGETEDYRVYEIAGVSHIPVSEADFREHGLPEQNPIDFGPAVRAAFVNLQEWIKGTEPPPSIAIELVEGEAESLMDAPLRHAVRDKDGNATGGVRLPHMATPLGSYEGMDYDHKDGNVYFLISGAYKPFSKEELARRYPDNDGYVKLVTDAANELVAQRYLLQEDAEAYIDAAKQSDIGRH